MIKDRNEVTTRCLLPHLELASAGRESWTGGAQQSHEARSLRLGASHTCIEGSTRLRRPRAPRQCPACWQSLRTQSLTLVFVAAEDGVVTADTAASPVGAMDVKTEL